MACTPLLSLFHERKTQVVLWGRYSDHSSFVQVYHISIFILGNRKKYSDSSRVDVACEEPVTLFFFIKSSMMIAVCNLVLCSVYWTKSSGPSHTIVPKMLLTIFQDCILNGHNFIHYSGWRPTCTGISRPNIRTWWNFGSLLGLCLGI